MKVDQLIEKAQQHDADGEYAEAVDAFERARGLDASDWRLPAEVGRLSLYMLSDAPRAVAAYEAALPLIADDLIARDTRYHLGVAHTFVEDDARAAVRFEEVLAHTPTHVVACIELGKLLTRRGEHARAKDLLQQAVLHNRMRSTLPEMFEDGVRGSAQGAALAWINFGRLAIATGNADDALNAASHLIADLGDTQRVLKLADEALAADQLDIVFAVLGQVIALGPDTDDDAYEQAAKRWFRIALADPEDFDASVAQAADNADDDPVWSRRVADEVLARSPQHAGALALRQRLGDA